MCHWPLQCDHDVSPFPAASMPQSVPKGKKISSTDLLSDNAAIAWGFLVYSPRQGALLLSPCVQGGNSACQQK